MKKSQPYDLNPIGKVISPEPRVKQKLKAYNQNKITIQMPSIDEVVKNIKDKYQVDQRLTNESQPLKTINFGSELFDNTQRVKSLHSKRKQQWNHNLNIPYYRKVHKKTYNGMRNEMEMLLSSPLNSNLNMIEDEEYIKISQSVTSFAKDKSSTVLPPIFSPKGHFQIDSNQQKTSLENLKKELQVHKKKVLSNQITKKNMDLQQFDQSDQCQNTSGRKDLKSNSVEMRTEYQSLQGNESTNTQSPIKGVKQLSVLIYDNPLELQSHQRNVIDYTKFKSQKAKIYDHHMQQQQHPLTSKNQNYDQNFLNTSLERILEINVSSQRNKAQQNYLTNLIKSKQNRKIRNKSGISLAVIKYNEKRQKDRYQDTHLLQQGEFDENFMKQCFIVTHQNDLKKDESQPIKNQIVKKQNKQHQQPPRAEELMKQLNLQ